MHILQVGLQSCQPPELWPTRCLDRQYDKTYINIKAEEVCRCCNIMQDNGRECPSLLAALNPGRHP